MTIVLILFGHFDIIKMIVQVGKMVRFYIASAGDIIRLGVNNLSVLDASSAGVDMYGDTTCTGTGSYNGTMTCSALIETSDANLKEEPPRGKHKRML